MVKIGFIVEGGSEKIIIESDAFKAWLGQLGVELVRPVIDAKGGGNLLPKNIEPMVQTLNNQGVDHIVILTDLEDDPSVQMVKDRIGNLHTDHIYIAIKAIEAWYLADTAAMNSWLKSTTFYEQQPQATINKPWDRIKEIAQEQGVPGPGASKISFAKKMVKHHAFEVNNSAQHANCGSASEFVAGIALLAGGAQP